MFRKSFITFIFVAAVVACGYAGALAQTAPVSGTVELAKADGTKEPVVGALVEVYRIDIKGSLPAAKTNKRGEFAFAGFPFGGTFTLAVNAPGCAPYTFSNVKAGAEKLLITVGPGDGRKFTEDEVRKNVAAKPTSGNGQTPEPSAEQKKAQEDYKKAVAENEAAKKKAEDSNKVINAALKDGNDAFNAKNYDVAVAKYEEGIAADPEFIGSVPLLLNNKSTALASKAVDTYNKAIKLTDPAEKLAAFGEVKKGFLDSAQGFFKAWNMEKNAPAADIVDRPNFDANKLSTLRGAHDTFWKAVQTEKVDPALIEIAKVLIPEYQAAETDAPKKVAAGVTFADLYRISEDRENAIAGYRKVLETSPDNVDAMAYLGLVLVDLAWLKDNDKALSQEGANYLQKFVSIAPDTNKLKSGAVEYLNILKTQSIVPVKSGPTKKKP